MNALTTKEILGLIEKAFKQHSKKVLPDREHLEGTCKEQLLAAHLAKAKAKAKAKAAMKDELSDTQMP
jgi:hypothetical protein